ncbi:hypothetical protein EMCG_05788 [[Emmonsia] crescens]|uniref:Uncharacterized protein n=1 Tax=[Emmonsia] crescens TaxID=73230 RepID=A0A0G2JC53_9EURO|nr:hypothetical protein EMCG_05788 [Emmonsia crescens UAMH 3008]
MTQQYFGNGTPIAEKYLALLAKITNEIRVLHKWQEDDGMDESPGKGIVRPSSACQSVPGAYDSVDWAQVVQALDG